MSEEAKEIYRFMKNVENELISSFGFEYVQTSPYVMKLLQIMDSHKFKVTLNKLVLNKLTEKTRV